MKYDLISVGGATEDITFYTAEGVLIDNKRDPLKQELLAFEYGAKIKVNKTHSSFGGGAANVAACFSGLGFKAACLAAVGDDERGEDIINNLKKKKVDTELVQVIKGEGSGFSLILVGQKNEHIVFSNRAANSKLQITGRDLGKLKNTRWIYLSSLSGEWRETLAGIFSVKRVTPHVSDKNVGVKIAWNPGHIQLNYGKAVLGKYLKKTEVLIVNMDEAIELVVSDKRYGHKDLRFLNNPKNLLTIIKDWGPKIVLITRGKYGASAYDGEQFYFAPAIRERKRIDTTGVGDAFGSSFIAGLELYQGDIAKAMKLGAFNTASVISIQGAQNGLLTKKDLKKLKI